MSIDAENGAGIGPAPFFALAGCSEYVYVIRMDTKLTLKLDSVAIERARRYARRRGTSLSRLVEQYFNSFSPGAGSDMQDESLFAGTTVGTLLDEASRWPENTSLDEDAARNAALEERYGPVQ